MSSNSFFWRDETRLQKEIEESLRCFHKPKMCCLACDYKYRHILSLYLLHLNLSFTSPRISWYDSEHDFVTSQICWRGDSIRLTNPTCDVLFGNCVQHPLCLNSRVTSIHSERFSDSLSLNPPNKFTFVSAMLTPGLIAWRFNRKQFINFP